MISVVIPLYNKEAIIKKSLESVLTQDYDDFEVVVVNDGSTDKSVEIVKSIQDTRITLIEQENGGPSKARNTGVKNARGEWILFLDADDELLPGALKHFSECCNDHPEVDMILARMQFDRRGRITKSYPYREGLLSNGTRAYVFGLLSQGSGSTVYKRSLTINNPYDEQIRRFEDMECLLRMYKEAKMWLTNYITVSFNCNNNSASKPRKDINEDFLGHLSFDHKSFWQNMANYKIFYREHANYENETKKLYPYLYRRYDLHLLMMIIEKMTRCKYTKEILKWIAMH